MQRARTMTFGRCAKQITFKNLCVTRYSGVQTAGRFPLVFPSVSRLIRGCAKRNGFLKCGFYGKNVDSQTRACYPIQNMKRVIAALVIPLCASLWAADPTGTVAGIVMDPSGAAIVGARITATNINTGLKREAASAADGGYVFPLLPVGTYSVAVEAQGFGRLEQRGVEVRTDESASVALSLKVGSSQQSVTVEAAADILETRSGGLRAVITEQNIVELPLNGRNAATLVSLSAGTADLTAGNARGSGDTQQGTTYPGAQSISANGARADTVNYNMDGGSNQDHYTNVNNPFPNPDAVEEFSVQTNSFSAEYGRGSGAVVNVVTKSGTNSLHGTAFEFLRNGDLNARNFFASAHDLLKRNQFGGSLGGPIKKDKLFFFGTYQGTQLRNVSLGNSATVFTPAQRAGDFSTTSRQLVNPFTGVAFPGNQIPTSLITPASTKLLTYLPVATAPSGIISYNLPQNQTENQYMGRGDYNLTNHRIYGRYFYSHYTQAVNPPGQNLISARSGLDFLDQNVSVSDTWTISPHALNSVLFAYNRYHTTVISSAPFSPADLGIPVAVTDPSELSVSVSSYWSIATGHPGKFNRLDYTFSDSFHWVLGSHELAFGGDFVRMDVDLNNAYRQNGQFTFNSTNYSGFQMADFLLGYAQKFIQGGGEFSARRGNMGSAFVQDNYRVARGVVLNLGLRWDPFVPYTDTLGRTECFLPGQRSTRFPNAPVGYNYAGDPGCPAGGFKTSWGLLAPRLGVAWAINQRTTVRSGFGIFYQPPFVEQFNNMVDSAPFSPQFQFFGVPFMNPFQGMTNPFPAQFGPKNPPSTVTFALPQSLAVAFQPGWTPSYTMNWNLTVERQIARDMLIRAGYVGTKGTHLPYNTDLNAPLPSAAATAANEQARRPYQDFGQITQDQSGGNSIYNALQLAFEKRFAHGVSLSANYTWSKTIDAVSYSTDLDGINVINPYNVRAYRGVSDYNSPQRFLVNYVWQLPGPKQGWQRFALGGWETSGIWTIQSGFPLDITTGGDYSFSNPVLSNDQAELIGTPQYTSGSRGQRILQWFTPGAFTTPANNTFGNVGRNTLVGPGTWNVDFSAHKVFPISERVKLQYRAEFFNFFNTPQFNNPNTTVTSTNFARITSARSPRVIQMALKIVF
jgi:hypothetical protein